MTADNMLPCSGPASIDWVPDSRFGAWFLKTETWSRYVLQESLGELCHLLPAGDRCFGVVLDLGCGAGGAILPLEKAFAPDRIIAIDADPSMLQRITAQSTSTRCPVEVHCTDAASTGLPDASVDLILCHELLHHVVDQPSVLHEALRVLKPGGWLLVAEACREFLQSPIVRLLFRHPKVVQKDPEEYTLMLRETGFAVDDGSVSIACPWWARVAIRSWRDRARVRSSARAAAVVHIAARRP